jgi:hypothetical protein
MVIAVWVQTGVLALTAYLIWRYTSATEKYTTETASLRNEAARQNRLSLRPIVLPEFPSVGVAGIFRLKNCGQGCAVNVLVLPVIALNLNAPEFLDMGQIESRFEPIMYLTAGETAEVMVSTWANNQKMNQSPFDYWFHPRIVGEETSIEIRFNDIEGGKYRIRVTVLAEQNVALLPRKVRLGVIEQL